MTRMTALAALALALCSGCASLNSIQRSEYSEMKARGVAVEEKNPKLAVALGFLPGCGSFYTRQWGLGVLDLFLWPASMIWDPFAGYSGAEVINYDVSRSYVKQLKAKKLQELERQLEDSQLTQAEFIERRRAIDDMYDFD